jgi:divalent metal cation (Fe/Co/Zn/Cd) transporter
MKSLLLGEAATPAHLEKILAAITSAPGIDRVIHQRTLHVGREEVVVAVKVAVPPVPGLMTSRVRSMTPRFAAAKPSRN